MSRRPVFQTDDIDPPNYYMTAATCECPEPNSLGRATMWACLICGKRVRGDKREAIRLRIEGPKKICADHHPRTGPVNADGVIPHKWTCPNCGAKVGKAKWKGR